MSEEITEKDRLDAVATLLDADIEYAPEVEIINALNLHRLLFDSARNLGYYRTFIECSCGAGWWYGEHAGDPSAADRWDIHRAKVIRDAATS